MTRKHRTVLVVESNALLSQFACDLVTANDCTALAANTADEAIAILQTRPDIVLLITNVVMGGDMDGVELAHAVDRRWPQVRVIVVSAQPGLSESDLPLRCRFLSKPYNDQELAFEIRALVGAPGRGDLATDGTRS